MTPSDIKETLEGELQIELALREEATPPTMVVQSADLKSVATKLYEDERFYFDMLSCLTAIDNGEEADTMEVVYHLYSIPFNVALALEVTIPRTNPKIETVSDLWRTADWHEREAFDLVGVTFENHPDLRRILLPNDWEGHPLRKDYKEQEKYHGMSVVYDRDHPMDNGELNIEN